MSGAYKYKPKFRDIRVRPPKPGDADEEPVAFVDPAPKTCEWPDCQRVATAQAPKSREHLNQRYDFCGGHAAEYNRGWDFFEGMTEGQIRAHQAASLTGDRPTWAFKASNASREAAALAAKMGRGEGVRDAFGMFGPGGRASRPEAAQGRQLGRLERAAFADMDMDEAADGPAIRARYTELVKRFHPDSNGGDRSAEEKLSRVVKAYKTLRAAKLA
jgi:hypothetical protein